MQVDFDLGPLTVEAFIEGWYEPHERAAARREFERAGKSARRLTSRSVTGNGLRRVIEFEHRVQECSQ